MVSWRLIFTTQAKKDAKKLARSGLKPQAERLLGILRENPYQSPPPYEKLVGDLAGACSRRINLQHRLVYQILDDIKTVKVISGCGHTTNRENLCRTRYCIQNRRIFTPLPLGGRWPSSLRWNRAVGIGL